MDNLSGAVDKVQISDVPNFVFGRCMFESGCLQQTSILFFNFFLIGEMMRDKMDRATCSVDRDQFLISWRRLGLLLRS